jgi:hypothetical protein
MPDVVTTVARLDDGLSASPPDGLTGLSGPAPVIATRSRPPGNALLEHSCRLVSMSEEQQAVTGLNNDPGWDDPVQPRGIIIGCTRLDVAASC